MSPEDMNFALRILDGFAGFAALINGLLLWPIVSALRTDHKGTKKQVGDHASKLDNHSFRLDNHEGRIVRLEDQ